ncbi:MAG: phytanoyl-CoA dioxygenase family protein [Candidatus Poribacteria bacterium]|nr:phytanoyl-CoA dioxygenase family protein [Candidatus Poribacteria bacterium]
MTERRKQFERGGYYVERGLYSALEVEDAKREISAVICGESPNAERIGVQIEYAVRQGDTSVESKELSVRKLMGYVPHSDTLTRLVETERIKEVTRDLLGDDVKMLQDMALLKPPFIGSRKTWHQDCAYFPIEPTNVVGLWIALDPATRENGCMLVYPGSHHELIHHENVEVDGFFKDFGILLDHPILKDDPVPVELESGDALLFHGLTLHGTEPNVSPLRRRAMQLHYMDAKCVYTRPNKPEFRQIIGRSYLECV